MLACWPLGADSSLRTATAAEFAEYRLFAPLTIRPKRDRLSKWQELAGGRHPNLQACILAANPSWEADSIPAR